MKKFSFSLFLFSLSVVASAQGCMVNKTPFSAEQCVMIERALKNGDTPFVSLSVMFTLADACRALGGEMDEINIDPQKETRQHLFITKDPFRCFVAGQRRFSSTGHPPLPAKD